MSTWSHTLRKEHRLRVLENRVLRKIFGPERDEVIGEWKRLHKRELDDLQKGKANPITGLDRRRGFQEVKVPRFRDNGTGWW